MVRSAPQLDRNEKAHRADGTSQTQPNTEKPLGKRKQPLILWDRCGGKSDSSTSSATGTTKDDVELALGSCCCSYLKNQMREDAHEERKVQKGFPVKERKRKNSMYARQPQGMQSYVNTLQDTVKKQMLTYSQENNKGNDRMLTEIPLEILEQSKEIGLHHPIDRDMEIDEIEESQLQHQDQRQDQRQDKDQDQPQQQDRHKQKRQKKKRLESEASSSTSQEQLHKQHESFSSLPSQHQKRQLLIHVDTKSGKSLDPESRSSTSSRSRQQEKQHFRGKRREELRRPEQTQQYQNQTQHKEQQNEYQEQQQEQQKQQTEQQEQQQEQHQQLEQKQEQRDTMDNSMQGSGRSQQDLEHKLDTEESSSWSESCSSRSSSTKFRRSDFQRSRTLTFLEQVTTNLHLEEDDDFRIGLDIEESTIRHNLKNASQKQLFENLINKEFPERDTPTLRDVIKTCTHQSWARKNGAHYSPGDWVEIRGTDMIWRLEMVTRVVKQAPDDWDWNDPENDGRNPDWNFLYHAGREKMLEQNEMRSSEEGLRRIFGRRPWVWQQWACLKLEHDLRFQKGHQDDFASKDVVKYASVLWDQWLNAPENSDFKTHFEDYRIGEIGRRELVHHLMTPFELIDEMKTQKEGSIWQFSDDKDISVYTYLAILGSGYFVPFVTFGLQIAIPCLLLAGVEGTEEVNYVTKGMVCVIMILYILKVVPDTVLSFTSTVGISDSVYSRLQSLQADLWSQADCSIGQMIGYKMDIYMNTVYTSLLYMLNMYILYRTTEAFEVLLNALAVEFVVRLDEEFTNSIWWDPDSRWLVSGAMELVIRNTLRQEYLESASLFGDCFEIPERMLNDACDGDENLLKNEKLAKRDCNNVAYMSKAESINHQCGLVALYMRNKNAIREYIKPRVHFSRIEDITKIGPVSHGMFNKYGQYRTWSRWERVLYLSSIPDLSTIFDVDIDTGHVRVRKQLRYYYSSESDPFANFYADDQLHSCLWHFLDVISFKHMMKGLAFSWRQKRYKNFVFRIFDGVIQWVAYVIQIIFPLVAIAAPILVFL